VNRLRLCARPAARRFVSTPVDWIALMLEA